MTVELDEDHPLWLVNEQIKGLLEGDGADEDHEDVLKFLRATGLPEDTVKRMHMAIVFGDRKEQDLARLRKLRAYEAKDIQLFRGLLLWVLYHHQGGSSHIGQPIRKGLGIGQHDPLTTEQVALAQAAGGKL